MDLNRPPQSASEIGALPAPGTEREAYVRVHADDFSPATLVFLMRECASSGNTALFERCAHALVGHAGARDEWLGGSCEGIIRSVAKTTPFWNDPEAFHDLRQETLIAMFRAILAGSDAKPFWEEKFGRALKHLCIDTARRLKASLKKHEWSAAREDVTETTEEPGLDEAGLEDVAWDRIAEQDLLTAIRRLPPRQARAAFLVLIERRAIGSDDPGSAMNVLGVSERAVYALLKKAYAALAADPQVRKFLENR